MISGGRFLRGNLWQIWNSGSYNPIAKMPILVLALGQSHSWSSWLVNSYLTWCFVEAAPAAECLLIDSVNGTVEGQNPTTCFVLFCFLFGFAVTSVYFSAELGVRLWARRLKTHTNRLCTVPSDNFNDGRHATSQKGNTHSTASKKQNPTTLSL